MQDSVAEEMAGPQNMCFRNPCAILLAGPSQSGKTTFVANLLRGAAQVFQKPSCTQNVIYFYHDDQPLFKMLNAEGIVHKWFQHLPTTQEIEELTAGFLETGSIIVIDDFQEQVTSDTVEIFTRTCHHRNAVVIMLVQNMFTPKKGYRTISLNSQYITLFKNPRDTSQIINFAKQFSSGSVPWVVKAFREATRNAHSYMLFDTHQATPEWARVRSDVLPHQLPMRLYVHQSRN